MRGFSGCTKIFAIFSGAAHKQAPMTNLIYQCPPQQPAKPSCAIFIISRGNIVVDRHLLSAGQPIRTFTRWCKVGDGFEIRPQFRSAAANHTFAIT